MTDGQANMVTIKALDADFSDYPAFKYCANRNTGGVTGWYLPAKDELLTLYTAYNTYGQAKFNALMTASGVGGVAFGSLDYWSSSESSSSLSCFVIFFNGSTVNYSKGNTLLVRCVRAF